MIGLTDGFSRNFRRSYRCAKCRGPISMERAEYIGLCPVCEDAEFEETVKMLEKRKEKAECGS